MTLQVANRIGSLPGGVVGEQGLVIMNQSRQPTFIRREQKGNLDVSFAGENLSGKKQVRKYWWRKL